MLMPAWPNLGEKTAKLSIQPWDWDVTAEDVQRVRSMAKPDRKKYMERTDILWNIYAGAKGENWFHPVSNENPPSQLLAFIADYDIPIEISHVTQACALQAKQKLPVPTHIETSLSKHIRCVWLFEKPVLCAGIKFGNEFLRRVGELVGADGFLPGIDRKSYDVSMRWTNGGYWHVIDFAKPMSAEILTGLAVKTAQAVNTKKTDLPLDKVGELLKQKYPNFERFNGGLLKLNVIGPRFWDEKADNPNGALCVDKGFVCVTGDKPLVTFDELLGKATVDTLRLVNYGDIAQDIYYDGVKYWVKKRGIWFHWDRNDVLLRIAAFGFDRSRQRGENMSPAEEVLNYIHNENRVDGAAPLLYKPTGVLDYQNSKMLNITRVQPMKMSDKANPVPETDFPWLWGFWNAFFAHPELKPKDYFFGWLHRFYKGAIDQKPTNGQAIFICGPEGCGKNLISEAILPMIFGGMAPNPYRFLMGETDFSDDIFAAPILAINDEDAPPEHKKTIFEQKVKGMVANNVQSFHPKFMKKVLIEWCGRLVATLNDGPKDLGVLPMLHPSTFHKMSFFGARKHNHPFYDRLKNREILEAELPHFLRWLIDVYELPAEVERKDRFGVNPFHDPFLVRANRQEQISYNLLELLGAWMHDDKWYNKAVAWSGTPTDLIRDLSRDETLEVLLKSWDPTKLSRALGDLARAGVPGVELDPEHKGRKYILTKDKILATIKGMPAVVKAVTGTLNLK